MSWTDERIATLKKMWLQGKSASEIAEKLGGVTRNAVIGKAHRLNLSGRPSPIKAAKTVPAAENAPVAVEPELPETPSVEVKSPVSKAPPTPKVASVAEKLPPATQLPMAQQSAKQPQQPARTSGNGPGKPAEIVQLAALANASSKMDGSTVSILELNERLCRWPVGDPRDAAFGYCGNDVYQAHPYCAEHVAIAFQAPNRKDKRPTKNVKEADAPELEDLDEIEVDVEDDEALDDTLEDDLDDEVAVV